MAKKLSQAERDRQRRERSSGSSKRNRNLAIGAVAVAAVVLLAVVLGGDEGVQTGDSRAANIATFGLADDPFKGNESADVVVVGFEAPTCSACRAFHFSTLEDMDAEFFQTGQAVFYYVQYKINPPADLDIGMMQECALREAGNDGFWDLTTRIYSLSAYPSVGHAERAFQDWGDAAGVRDAAWACYKDRDTSTKVTADWGVGDGIGVSGTPTFYVFGTEGEPVQAHSGNLQSIVRDFVARA